MDVQDKVGINAALLDEVQTKLLGLYGEPPIPGDPLTPHPGTIFQESVTATLYKATMHLLDDLHNNCRMLGVPERYVPLQGCQIFMCLLLLLCSHIRVTYRLSHLLTGQVFMCCGACWPLRMPQHCGYGLTSALTP